MPEVKVQDSTKVCPNLWWWTNRQILCIWANAKEWHENTGEIPNWDTEFKDAENVPEVADKLVKMGYPR